jgi:hypothetical protein
VKERFESFKVKGDELLARARWLIHEGNVRRIVIEQKGQTIAEFPLTVGVVGAVGAPALAAIAGLAALLTDCTLHVSRVDAQGPRPKKGAAPHSPPKKATRKR